MKLFLKPIFEWITNGYSLFNNPMYNYISMGIVGLIAFLIAWNIVGKLYGENMIQSRIVGSIIHWIIRLISFILLFSAVSLILRVVKFIISVPIWIWLIIAGIVSVCIVLYVIIKFRQKKQTEKGTKVTS